MAQLKGKVALITGAASDIGIGYATARKFGCEGAKVCITDIDGKRMEARVASLCDDGIDAVGFTQDVTNEGEWKTVVATIVDRHGRIDVLVNNAGAAFFSPTLEFSIQDWNKQIDINLSSVFLGCRTVIDQLLHQGDGGAIINISSVAGQVGIVHGAAYSSSKGGVRLLTKSLALEFARQNIRVNSVHPGAIATEIAQRAMEAEPEHTQAFEAAIPMGRQGEPSDVAAMAAFLASEEAKYITGAEFCVDGGLTA